jgi:hypothetical protein
VINAVHKSAGSCPAVVRLLRIGVTKITLFDRTSGMKRETRQYSRTLFPVEVIRKALKRFREIHPPDQSDKTAMTIKLESGGDRGHDSDEEFFSDYRANRKGCYFGVFSGPHDNRPSFRLMVSALSGGPSTTIHVETFERAQALSIIDVFESVKGEYQQALLPKPIPPKPVVFLGHGRSTAWRELKDHLHEKHGFAIEAYEIGARAGHAVRDILEGMLDRSSIAFLVMTGEDETADGDLNPRLNVVHEAGLFQGRLGFNRAIILLEQKANDFSNIQGLEQIRFANIREVYGDVVASIRREFPSMAG